MLPQIWTMIVSSRGHLDTKSSKSCGLCLTEKIFICEYADKKKLINDRSELEVEIEDGKW